jgi:hypothetical protein
MRRYGAAGVLLAAFVAAADALPTAAFALQLGDCVIFHEGGGGLVLKSPTYWLRGSVAGISQERRMAGPCPDLGKPASSYTHEDWVRLAAALPCVENDADQRAVNVTRIRVAVEDWETPWSYQHGTAGWLFRGQFLDQRLKKGELIDLDASWLEPCQGVHQNSSKESGKGTS